MAQSAARNAIVYALHKYLRIHTDELRAHVRACLNSRSRLHSIINITLTLPISPVPHPLAARRSRTQHTHAHTQHRCGGGGSGGEAVLLPVRHRINKRVWRESRERKRERVWGWDGLGGRVVRSTDMYPPPHMTCILLLI